MKQFIQTFNEVFDENGNVKPCGREKCKELIAIASRIDNKTNFGDIHTGFMKVKNLKHLKEILEYENK